MNASTDTILILSIVNAILLLAVMAICIILIRKTSGMESGQLSGRLDAFEKGIDKIEKSVAEQILKNREEASTNAKIAREEALSSAKVAREEMIKTLMEFNNLLSNRMTEIANFQKNQLETFASNIFNESQNNEMRFSRMQVVVEEKLAIIQGENKQNIDELRQELSSETKRMREETAASFKIFNDSLVQTIDKMIATQRMQLESFSIQLSKLTESNEHKLESLRNTIEEKLLQIQADNTKKLNEIRQDMSVQAKQMRDDTASSLKNFNDSIIQVMVQMTASNKSILDGFSTQLAKLTETNESKLETLRNTIEEKLAMIQWDNTRKLNEMRQEFADNTKQAREETTNSLKNFNDSVVKTLDKLEEKQTSLLENLSRQFMDLTLMNENRLEKFRTTLESKLGQIQEDNSKKLEEMRRTVDEKLHSTLEQRLGDSFKIVSDRLELVHKGLGEMQTLAAGVGDLKKVLSNIKTRGTWGEIQLGNLLSQILTADQYSMNVVTKEHTGERVEYAIKLPGRGNKTDEIVWLPIDAKFPQDHYISLIEASESGDMAIFEAVSKQFENAIKKCAKDIYEKYINPPKSTDFAIMFLPTEGLYAEVVRRSSLIELIQRDYRVVVSGPSTLAALLNALQMGFRTLAIEKRSSEVWNLLGAIKTEFGNFSKIMDSVKKKIVSAGYEIDKASRRTRVIESKLSGVQELPEENSASLLGTTVEEHTTQFVRVSIEPEVEHD